jgi:hypothetical protein
MFNELFNLVKDQLSNNPEVANAIPGEQKEAVSKEVAAQLKNGMQSHASSEGGIGGLLSSITGSIGSGNPLSGAISGGLVSSLASKFGLSPAITGAIAGALPGLLAKFAEKANDPNDPSLTPEGIQESLARNGKHSGLDSLGGLGSTLGGLFK